MPLKEDGATYPRRVFPAGLPPGWKAIEKAYSDRSKSAGQTYVRFDSPCGKHKHICTIKGAITLYAQDNGIDADLAVLEWQQMVEEEKNERKTERQREREENGYAESPKLEEYVALFRERHGALDGATVCNLPGWRGESKWLENCGQNVAKYYSPTGWTYPLLKNIEAFFGFRIQAGLEVPDIEAARKFVKRDETGKAINVARRENVMQDFTASQRPKKKKRRGAGHFEERHVTDDQYEKSDLLHVLELRVGNTAESLERHGVANISELLASAESIRDILSRRGFGYEIQLLYVTGGPEADASSFLHALSGIYYLRCDRSLRPCYQQIFLSQECVQGASCTDSHLFWSAERSCWKLGVLDERLASFARCFEDAPRPVDMAAPWLVFKAVPPEE